MPFIPHSDADVRAMLAAIGVEQIEDLFDEIPEALKIGELSKVPEAMNEMALSRLMRERARLDEVDLNFAGAGAYEHHIPAAIWQIVTRGEFYSAYTPYQAEASQGTLQVIYEFQSMMTQLTALQAANASLYDGASALAEAVLMAVRANRKSKSRRVLMPRTVHPLWRRAVHSIVHNQDIELVELDYDRSTGRVDPATVSAYAGQDFAALVVPQPNVFGMLEEVDALTDLAHANGWLAIAAVNPVAMALIEAPGHWGETGADIAVGEGQPLGVPLSSGGPYYGFMCTKLDHVRQMPGRIVGRTVDLDGKPGFTLTLQAREQHIRRSKATSNICTNQGLAVTASTIHMSLLGAEGLRRVAAVSHANAAALVERLTSIDGVESVFDGPSFHERVLRLPVEVDSALRALAADNVIGGFALGADYPELADCVLVCATETRTPADIEHYGELLGRIVSR